MSETLAHVGGEYQSGHDEDAATDTDQTGESVTAWFGDFRLAARP